MRHWIPFALTLLAACGDAPAPEAADDAADALKADAGVDVAAKVITVGALNDESGPAAAIGKPYALGKRLLAARVNAGGSGLLPDGWTIQLVERDHGYNPQQSVQAYDEIKEQVLFVGTSFGTPNTLPLRPKLEVDSVLAFPASLSSAMAEHPNTPPLGASYTDEARRAMDFMVSQAESADAVKAGIVYQKDDYGKDGLAGFETAAE
ncbi:MAG: ABC transporter substrate-binding protein, partial [Myxococcota bacterium]